MANARKLQSEIDRVLKKVDEGSDFFDEIWAKVQSAETQNLKEKHEMDLKKEIKKLQRLRDQIKTWVASTEVKDKDALVEARKLIETKMETFKVCEKETKTKTYSKEGLAREDKIDPEEEAKLRTTSWLAEYVERFQQQVEEKDFDIEKLSAGKGKKQNKSQIEQLQKHIANHKYHITKLEGIIRLINNDVLEPDPVDALQEDIDYYLDSYQEEQYIQLYEQDFFYESLGLDELELVNVDRLSQPVAPAKKGDDTTETSSKESKELKNGKKAAASVIPMTIGRARSKAEKKADQEREESEAAAALAAATAASNGTSNTTSTPTKGGIVSSPPPAPQPVVASPPIIQPGASMAAILKRESEQQEKERQKQLLLQQEQLRQQQLQQQQEQLRQQQAAQEALQRQQQQQQEALRQQQQQQQQAAAAAVAAQQEAAAAAAAQQVAAQQLQQAQQQQRAAEQQKSQTLQNQQLQQQQGKNGQQTSAMDILSSGLGGLGLGNSTDVRSKETPNLTLGSAVSVGSGSVATNTSGTNIDIAASPYLSALNESFVAAPNQGDLERSRQYTPQNPYPTPISYPATPSPIFDTPAVFEKLGTDCLFFIFYYAQGTYQQYLAARELKKQSWRFHKKYMTWFQRHEEPKITTDEYEQGTYVYFDYETGWCTRIKQDFRFEYSFLEDSLQ